MAVLSVDALPLGFRFRPTDFELVDHYLKGKIRGSLRSVVEEEVIPEIDICKCEPWDLPGKSLIKSSDPEWFFFSPKDRKYSNGQRFNRATRAGYWKATGRDRSIKSGSKGSALIGMKRTLVFYQGRAPKGVRSHWVMHEYRTTEPEFDSGEQGGFVLCRLFRKSEDGVTTLEVNVSTEGNVDEAERLFPIINTSLEETEYGGEARVEGGLTSLDQNLLQLEMQADSQNLSITSNTQPTSTNMLSEDRIQCESSNMDENYCSITAALDNAYNETDVEGVEVADLLDDLAELSNLDHVNYPMLPSMEFTIFDGYDNGLQSSLFSSDNNIEEGCINEFWNPTIFHTEESLPGMSNAMAESSTAFVPEGQNCIIVDHSTNNVVLSKESNTCSKEDIGGTNALEDVGLFEALEELHSYPSNCVLDMEESKNQVTCEHNAYPLDYSGDHLYHEFSASIEPMRAEFSRDLASNKKTETIQANLDHTGIQIRARHNLSSSENFQEHQGLAMRRMRLQKSMHNVSVARTENESTTYSENVHKSIISEVEKYEKKLADEGTTDSGSGYVDNVWRNPSGDIRTTSYQDERSIADTSCISSELSFERNSKSNLGKRWPPETTTTTTKPYPTRPPENIVKYKGGACGSTFQAGSNSMTRVMIIMLTTLLFLSVVITWFATKSYY